jgi:hypothetical protein
MISQPASRRKWCKRFLDEVSAARFTKASVAGAIVGLIAITIYLVVERALAGGLALIRCLLQLLQWDASNAYGRAAFSGGWTMGLIGLAMDFFVSLAWGIVFTVLYSGVPSVRRNVIVSGLAFGACVMAVMIFAIVPIGYAPQMHKTQSNLLNVLIAHTVFFGLPVALTVQRVLRA